VTVERERSVGLPRPVPNRLSEVDDEGGTIILAMPPTLPAGPAGPTKIEIPRWIQLVGLPLLLVFTWAIARAAGHAVFIFLVAAIVAFLLDPLVRGLQAIRIPRGFAVAIVYLSFAGALIVAIGALATVVVDQTTSAANRVDAYFTEAHGQPREVDADRDVDRLQRWLNTHHLSSVKVQERGHKAVQRIRERDVGKYTSRVIDFVEGAAISIGKTLFALVLLIVISIYMLLDMPRFMRTVDRRFPPREGEASLVIRIEKALSGYVKGQLLLSLIIGTSGGVGLWLLGIFGWMPNGDKYALLFGGWVALTEVIPYLGPWLGAIPPFVYALVVHPVSAIWVALLFLVIHQVEGHIVVPNVMGSALRLHPLLVIFGLLVGGEVYGLAGALMSLPLLAAARATWEFFSERVKLEPWSDAPPGPVPVEIEPVGHEPPAAARG
jgi:predicted PurR-regulated permease PerM